MTYDSMVNLQTSVKAVLAVMVALSVNQAAAQLTPQHCKWLAFLYESGFKKLSIETSWRGFDPPVNGPFLFSPPHLFFIFFLAKAWLCYWY